MLKKIFSKKNHTLDSLQGDYKTLEQRKTELTDEISVLKRGAFKGEVDTKKLVDALQKLELELGLLDPAQNEIKELMASLIEKQIAADYKNLPGKEKKYQTDFDKQARDAGQKLGQVVKIFESLDKQPFASFAQVIRVYRDDALLNEKHLKNMTAFDAGYLDAMNDGTAMQDFKDECRAIDRIRAMSPGSDAARNEITNTVRRLCQ